MAKPLTPLVIEFLELTQAQRDELEAHPATIAAPIQSREDERRWIVAFRPDGDSRDELFSAVRRWARRHRLPPPRRRM